MTAPFVRAWFAARLTDWVDHGYACWRGTLHALGISAEWDPCEIEARYLLDLPDPETALRPDRSNDAHGAPQGSTEASPCKSGHGDRVGELHFHTLMPCPVCHVSVGKDCVTRFGNVTGPHRARRDAAARQTAAEVAS